MNKKNIMKHNNNGGKNHLDLVNKHHNLEIILATMRTADVAEVATLKKDNVSLQHNILALITKWIKNKKLKRQTYTNVCLFYL